MGTLPATPAMDQQLFGIKPTPNSSQPPPPATSNESRGFVRNIVAWSALTANQIFGKWSPLPFLPPLPVVHRDATPSHRRSLSTDQMTRLADEDVGTPASMHRSSSVAIESHTVVLSSTTTTISTACSNQVADKGAVAHHRTLERLLELGMNPLRLATAVLSWSLSRLGVNRLLQDVASNGDSKQLETERLISEYAREISRAEPTLTDFEAALLQTLAERRVRQNLQQYGDPAPQPIHTTAKVQKLHGPRIVIPVDVSCSVVCQPPVQHYKFPSSPRNSKSVFTTRTTTTSATILGDPETWSRSRSVSASVVSTSVELDSSPPRRRQPKVPANGKERLPQSAFHLRPMTSLRRVSFQSDTSDSDDDSSEDDDREEVFKDGRVVGELSVKTTATTRTTTRTTTAMTGAKVVAVDLEAWDAEARIRLKRITSAPATYGGLVAFPANL
ncbi:hypothetical protein BJ742DRAFT_834144 [Cladochytrium replicatum]|nr:hypothetical protein BJ742DRAFT_834144 [Cladochytrium replicatum]